MSLFLTIVVIMLLFANPPLTKFVLDHEYAGDVASLGLSYESGDNDYEIIVSVDSSDRLFDMIKGASEYELT